MVTWTKSPLGDIAEVKTGPFGSTLHASDYVMAGTPIITVEHLGECSITRQNLPLVSDDDKKRLSSYTLQTGDIVLSRVGSVDRNAYVTNDEDGWLFSGRLLRIRISRADLDSKYLSYYFKFDITMQRIRDIAVGQTMASLNTKLLNSFIVEYPPLPEQRAIAAALSDVDGYISALERLIAKKRNIKKGAMQELLTGKRRLPGFSGERLETTLGRIGIFSKGRGISKQDANSGSIPCVRYGEIYTVHNDFVKVFHSHISPSIAVTSHQIKKGDLLFAGSGETKEEIGKCVAFVSDCEAYAGGDIIVLSPFDNFDSLFLGYYLNSREINEQKASRGQGDAIVHIHITSLSEVEVNLPTTKTEQSAIAAILFDMDAEIDALTAKLNKVRDIKQGMTQELLTGRIRLLGDEAEDAPVTKPVAKVIELPRMEETEKKKQKHIEGYEDAVILVALVNAFGTQQHPFTAFDCQKFPYLFHRHMEGVAKGFEKFAAGPYNPAYKYKTALPIALGKKYIREHVSNYKGFVVDTNSQEALAYFKQWYGDEPLKWFQQFRYISNRKEELELLTTTDMAMVELREAKKSVNLQAVKELIKKSPAWKDKLKRPIFSDENIIRAIKWSNGLFGTEALTDA